MNLSELNPQSTSDAEEWLRKLYETVARKRQVMYQFIAESERMIMLGNGGGVALAIEMVRTTPNETLHGWLIFNVVTLILGVLFSALSLVFVMAVSIKEAHSAELSLHQFLHERQGREKTMFFMENTIPRLAIIASIWALLSIVSLSVGGLSILTIHIFYY